MRKSMTYGVLPTREEFDAAFEAECRNQETGTLHLFTFTNDPRVGTCELTCSELWAELEKAQGEWESDEPEMCECTDRQTDLDCPTVAGQWCSDVLGVLGFEWI